MRDECVESSEQLRKLRESHNLTQSDMANAAECSLRNYQNYEYGKSQPTYSILSHIIRNLPADPRELFERSICDEDDTTRDRINRLLNKCNKDQLKLILRLAQDVLDEWPAGEREIPMTEGVKQAFLMEREFQSQAEISSKSRVDGYDDFIFVNRYGDIQNQGNLNKALRRMMRDCNDEILEKYGADSDPVLLPQFSCHILRHTFATRLCESGANLKFIQSILGHADVSTTMNIYVDVTDALKKKEITAFDDYMTTKLET